VIRPAHALLIALLVASSGGCTSTTVRASSSGVVRGEYAGEGQNIQRIAFDVDGRTVSKLHGTYAVSCASGGGSSYQLQTFTDPESMGIDSGGRFTGNYRFTVNGGAQATLTVDGSVSGSTATGHLQFTEPYCGTPLDGWSAATSGHVLPPVPTFSAPSSSACRPQPCSVLGGVGLQIEAVRVVMKTGEPDTRGIDVQFSVDNSSARPVSVSDRNMTLTPQGGAALYSSYADFVDASGQPVGCLHGNVPLLPPGGSETEQHACFLPPADQIGQPLTLTWQLAGSGRATVDIGTAR